MRDRSATKNAEMSKTHLTGRYRTDDRHHFWQLTGNQGEDEKVKLSSKKETHLSVKSEFVENQIWSKSGFPASERREEKWLEDEEHGEMDLIRI